MPRFSSNLIGIVCVIGAVATFSTNDMAIKWLSGDYALHQVVFFRSIIALTVTLGVLVPLEGGYRILKTQKLKMHIARGLCVVLANMTFFASIAVMPLAEATAIFFVAPLLITVLSVPILGEKVGLRRLGAVIVGLIGVIVMIRPGSDSFQWAAMLPLFAACAYAMLQILTRKLGLAEKASSMAFFIQATFLVVCVLFGLIAGDGRFAPGTGGSLDFLLRAWTMPSGSDVWVMLGIGCLASVGGYLISQGYRSAEAGLVAPFEYMAMPLAIFWSISIWGDWPDTQAWIGIALITGAGLYVFYRETTQGRRNAVKQPMPRDR